MWWWGLQQVQAGSGSDVTGVSIAACSCSINAKGQKFSCTVGFIFSKQPRLVHKELFPQRQTLPYAILINILTLERDKRHFVLISLYFLKLPFFFLCFFPAIQSWWPPQRDNAITLLGKVSFANGISPWQNKHSFSSFVINRTERSTWKVGLQR